MDMKNANRAVSVLKSGHVHSAIIEELSGPNALKFLESTRRLAIQRRMASSPNQISASLLDAESSAVFGQIMAIDVALKSILVREGRLQQYTNHVRDDEPDLPPDPNSLKDPAIAFRYGVMRTYRRQFEVTINEQKAGGWPLLVHDLLEPLDGKRNLLVSQFPDAAKFHADTSYLQLYSSAQAREALSVLRRTEADLNVRLAAALRTQAESGVPKLLGGGAIVIRVLRAVIEVITGLEVAHDVYIIAKEAAEKVKAEIERMEKEEAAKRAWDKAFGDKGGPREIPNSSDHVDRFDKNGGIIAGTC